MTYLYLYCSEKVFEQCGQKSAKAGLLLGPFAGVLLLPLDVESRGGADKAGGTFTIGAEEEGCMVEDSAKTEGSDDQRPWEVGRKCPDLGDSKPAFQKSVGRFEFVHFSSLAQ